MDGYLRQSTAQTVMVGPYLDVTDGVTPETGLAGNGTELSKAGATYAAGPTLGTHDAEGEYPISLTTTHTNTVGILKVKSFDAAVHCPVWHTFQVLEEAVYDALFAASAPGYVANAPVNVAQFGGSNGTFSSGRPEVNTTHVGGTSQTARDLGASVLLSPGTGTGQVALASGAVTVGTNNDKTGYALTQTFPSNFSEMVINATGGVAPDWANVQNQGTLVDLTQTVVAQVSDFGGSVMLDSASITAIWANGTRTLTAGTNIVLAKGTGVTGFNDIAAGAAMSLANNAITTAAINDGAITDAKFTVPTVTGVASGILSKIVQNWMFHYLPSEYDPDEETFTTFAANGTTVVTTQSATVVGNVQRKGNAT
jgi:hypothetical protein